MSLTGYDYSKILERRKKPVLRKISEAIKFMMV